MINIQLVKRFLPQLNKFHFRLQKNQTVVRILKQLCIVHILRTDFCNIHFQNKQTNKQLSLCILFIILDQNFIQISQLPIRVTRPVFLRFFNLIVKIISAKEFTSVGVHRM